MARTTYKGATFDQRTADMLRELDRRTPGIPVAFMQGSYSSGVTASAGTHSGGGAVDIGAAALSDTQRQELIALMRSIGFAAWLRTPDEGFPWHIHGIAKGCVDLSIAARAQVAQYYAGLNGLASRGPDDGPRDHVGVTWETYQAPAAIGESMKLETYGTGIVVNTGKRRRALLNDEEVRVWQRLLAVMRQDLNQRERDVIDAVLDR